MPLPLRATDLLSIENLVIEEKPALALFGGTCGWAFLRSEVKSRFKLISAIFLTWDDCGGWYDHVPPSQVAPTDSGSEFPA